MQCFFSESRQSCRGVWAQGGCVFGDACMFINHSRRLEIRRSFLGCFLNLYGI